MKVLKSWNGKEALTVYKKEFASAKDIPDDILERFVDYIELCEIPGSCLNALFVTYKENISLPQELDKIA